MNPTTLHDLRRARGITLEELAAVADISVTFISRCERGLGSLSPDAYERLATIFGIPATALIAGQEALRQNVRAALAARLAGGNETGACGAR